MIIIELNKIYKQDCIEGMKQLIQQGYFKSFDFIEIDPPYNIGKDKWDKFESHEKYLEFIKEVIELSNQLMSDNGTLFLWHNDIEVLSDFIQLIKNNTDLKLKQQCIWNKYYKYNNDGSVNNQYGFLNGFIQSDINRSYQKMCEYALYYTKQDETGLKAIQNDLKLYKPIRDYFANERKKTKLTYKQLNELMGVASNGGGMASNILTSYKLGWTFPTEEKYKLLQKTGICQKPYEELKEEYDKLRIEYEQLRQKYEEDRYTFNSNKNNYRSCIWNYPMSKETKHKTEKPLRLYRDLFEVHTKSNSKCLFPFIGSGNNIVSLLNLNNEDNGNREYIGFETDDKWFNLVDERIDNTYNKGLKNIS